MCGTTGPCAEGGRRRKELLPPEARSAPAGSRELRTTAIYGFTRTVTWEKPSTPVVVRTVTEAM